MWCVENSLWRRERRAEFRFLLASLLSALVLVAGARKSAAQQQAESEKQNWADRSSVQEKPLRRNQMNPWDADNLDLVSATASQIRLILEKDPGLMVELKRLLAKQASDQGQIVSEQDLQDPVIFDRLETDTRFRSLATRLLQRYGYLTPQMNPKSFEAEEQELFMKARAERWAQAEMNAVPVASQRSDLRPCRWQEQENLGCEGNANPVSRGVAAGGSGRAEAEDSDMESATRSQAYTQACADEDSLDSAGGEGEDGGGGDGCATGPGARPGGMPNLTTPGGLFEPGQSLPPGAMPNLLDDGSLLTASAMTGGPAAIGDEMSPAAMAGAGASRQGGMAGGPGYQNSPGGRRATDRNNVSGTMSASTGRSERLPGEEPYSREAWPPKIPDSVKILHSPSPYAYVPSLADLYVQAAPRTAALERFGLTVFRHDSRNNHIPMDLPAGPEYVVGPGDRLTIDLWGGVSQRIYRTVDREGRLELPEAGPLQVTGRPLGEIQEVVQRVMRTQYRDVSADVALTGLRTVRVYVVGEVTAPGAYDVSSLSTPLNALWMAGGVDARGSLRQLRHMRGNRVVEQVDVYDLLLHGVRGDLQNFQAGDTLLVPPMGPQVTIDGMVRRPAIYELHNETNLAQVLELAGGMLPAAALRHIEVQRLEEHRKRTMLSVNMDETATPQDVRAQLAAFAVHDGDEVHIFPIAPYNRQTVYLQGHVLRPGRYAYEQGMTVASLLGSYQELLPEPAGHYAEIIRLAGPDWRPEVENFDLGSALEHPEKAPKLEPLDTVRIFGRYDLESPPVVWLYGEVRAPGEYRATGQMHLRDAIYEAGGLQPDAALDSAQLFRTEANGSFKILNVNLAAAMGADPLENVLVQPRDRILVHRSLERVDPPSVYVRGEVANPGRYPLAENMRIADLLGAAGGVKRGADMRHGDLTRSDAATVGGPPGGHERLDLTNLAADPARNLQLEDGDVLSVPQLPGWNDRGAAVTLKGEVKNPGVYGIRPGERISSVIARAGGLLPTAYPQGAIFTREAVRELQEKSREDLIQRLEQQSPEVKGSATTSGTEEAALQTAALQQRDRAIEALRRAPVSGRMVVRMPVDLKGFDHSSQDIPVMNGDSIVIPKQPGFVLVIGQVYNTNAVTYVPGRNAGWYLGQGGGVTSLGDRGAIFIVRASGEVVGRRGNGWWTGSVLAAAVRPGDTLVVPEKPVSGGARWKNLIALAQVAEAGAITAALIP